MDEGDDSGSNTAQNGDDERREGPSAPSTLGTSNTSMSEAGQDESAGGRVRVPVHEDFLFDVDIERRELCPAFWLGPIFEVRRGTWFYQEGSTLRACEENLASQLEEGYLKVKPFRYPNAPETSTSRSTSRPTSTPPVDNKRSASQHRKVEGRNEAGSCEVAPIASTEDLRASDENVFENSIGDSKDTPASTPHQLETCRLFGTYMNSIVTYQDSKVAWLSSDNIISKWSNSMYQKFAGGGYLSGVKIVRGYSEPGKGKDSTSTQQGSSTPNGAAMTRTDNPPTLALDERQQKLLNRRSAPPSTTHAKVETDRVPDTESAFLETFPAVGVDRDSDKEAEAIRKRDELEIQNDYNDRDNENQAREIEHLILVTHG